jgi:2',3'-cyclic-nucleotide 2'-phosphodiesterase (5'-nucleotidase family)
MTHLTIVQLNDIHAYLELHPELFWAGDRATYRPAGGYARIATLLQQLRQEQTPLLAFDCGDTFHGTYPAVQTRGEALLPILQQLNLDAMTGHWDFAYSPQRLKELAAQLPYPMLALNCFEEESGDHFFEPYTILETGGLRVAAIGLAAYIVDQMSGGSFSEGITMTLGAAELPHTIAMLRDEEKVDLVVVISHLGFPQEMQLAREVSGIDVLLSAHTHNRLWAPARAGETLVIQSGSHGSFLGHLTLQIEKRRVVDFRHRLLVVEESIAPDPQMAAIVDDVLAPHRALLDEVVGETRTALNRGRILESTMDNFLLHSLLHTQEADIALSHGWRYGAPIPPGPVTVGQLYNITPMDPALYTVELSGEEIWQMLEKNLEQVFARNPYDQVGGYVKRALGLNAYIKIENPPGQRLQELFIRGEPIQPTRTYSAVHITTQGVPPSMGQNRHRLNTTAVQAMTRYLQDNSPVEIPLQDTFVAV